MKKLLAILMALLFILTVIGCNKGSDDSKNTGTGTTTDSGEENVTQELTADIPDTTYNGTTFRVHTRVGDWSTDIFVEGTSEQLTDTVSEAVYNRNQRVSNKLDIAYEVISDNESPSTFIYSGDDEFQVIVDGARASYTDVLQGGYVEFKQLKYVDLEKPWWNQSASECLTIGGNLYGTYSDYAFNYLQCTACLYVNFDLLTEVGVTESIYDTVNNGQWTFDRFIEISKLGSKDLDLDDDINIYWDRYGYVTQLWGGPANVIFAQDGKLSEKDENDYPVLVIDSARNEDICSKYVDFVKEQEYAYCKDGIEVRECFKEGRAIFCEENFGVATIVFRYSDVNYGIIPLPKYDEAQTDYYTSINAACNIVCVPKTNKQLEMTSAVLELFSYDSYMNVIPAYYDLALCQKGTRDDESIEMLNLIKDGIKMDLAYNLGNLAGLDSICVMIMDGQGDNFLAYYNANREAAETSLADMINKFKENA